MCLFFFFFFFFVLGEGRGREGLERVLKGIVAYYVSLTDVVSLSSDGRN